MNECINQKMGYIHSCILSKYWFSLENEFHWKNLVIENYDVKIKPKVKIKK
jgi:hypothetical protein